MHSTGPVKIGKENPLRHLIRQIIYEHACACEEEGMELPIPGVAYPIEIEEIIVDPVMDLVTAPAGDPAIEIGISHDALEPTLDTIESIFPEEKPKGHKKGSEYGRMTRGKLYRMTKMSQSLHDRLDDGQDIPEWTKDKISSAEDRLRSAYDYMDYKLHRMKEEESICSETIAISLEKIE